MLVALIFFLFSNGYNEDTQDKLVKISCYFEILRPNIP